MAHCEEHVLWRQVDEAGQLAELLLCTTTAVQLHGEDVVRLHGQEGQLQQDLVAEEFNHVKD